MEQLRVVTRIISGKARIARALFSVAIALFLSGGLVQPGRTASSVPEKVELGPSESDASEFTPFGGDLYFAAQDSAHGKELWRYDPAGDTFAQLTDIYSGTASSDPYGFVGLNGSLYFTAEDGDHGRELWQYDPGAVTATLVSDIHPFGSAFPAHVSGAALVVCDDDLYFGADDSSHGKELWRYDPDTVTATLVADIYPGASEGNPTSLAVLSDTVYFAALTDTHGVELWMYEPGVSAQPAVAADVYTGTSSSYPVELAAFDGAIYFGADDGVTGKELWRYDPVAGSAGRVADINPGGDSNPYNLAPLGGDLYFAADDGTHGVELWRYEPDGGTAGLVADINPGDGDSFPYDLVAFDGDLYFGADDGTHGVELWRYDPDSDTASMVVDLVPGDTAALFASSDASLLSGATPSYITGFGGRLWFVAYPQGASVYEIFRLAVGNVDSPRLITPNGDDYILLDDVVAFEWQALDGATGYQLVARDASGRFAVLSRWYPVTSEEISCSDTACSVEPELRWENGAYEWTVRAWGPTGYGAWSAAASFSVDVPVPAPAQPTGLSTIVAVDRPTFYWNEDSNATWYNLHVDGASGTVLEQWYEVSSSGVNCTGGVCSVTPEVQLGDGDYSWWIQGWGPAGSGLWSDEATFTIGDSTGTPATPSLYGPSGTVSAVDPTFTWSDDATNTTWYLLWVDSSPESVHQQWYRESDICASGTCAVAPDLDLSGGDYTWYVQGYGTAGYGDWSAGMDFTLDVYSPPAPPILRAPIGPTTAVMPTFEWDRVDNATWYLLWVSDSSGDVLEQWYEAGTACTGTSCSVMFQTLPFGDYTWSVRSYCPGGLGAYSVAIDFTRSARSRVIDPPTNLSPDGATISDNPPAFEWQGVYNATDYYVWVDGPSGILLNEWYEVSSACMDLDCAITPAMAPLETGSYAWSVLGFGGDGAGFASSAIFTVTADGTTPPNPSRMLPLTDPVTDTTPTMQWWAASDAEWYHLYVDGSTMPDVQVPWDDLSVQTSSGAPSNLAFDAWYRASDICAGGICTATVTTPLAGGVHRGYVRPWNAAVGEGPVSNSVEFMIQVEVRHVFLPLVLRDT